MKFEARADESVGLCRFLILISPLAAMEKRVSLSLTARRDHADPWEHLLWMGAGSLAALTDEGEQEGEG